LSQLAELPTADKLRGGKLERRARCLHERPRFTTTYPLCLKGFWPRRLITVTVLGLLWRRLIVEKKGPLSRSLSLFLELSLRSIPI
jgi:hypothetical protein